MNELNNNGLKSMTYQSIIEQIFVSQASNFMTMDDDRVLIDFLPAHKTIVQ
jgi:hypothetical protein